MTIQKQLRFAPLIRVSTERQAKRGESLHTQKRQLESAVQAVGGIVYKWYAGQEHATPEHERKIIRELMNDATSGKFDAIMVTDTSRWSRDNQKSKEYLNILKSSDVKFFVLTREYNLFDPVCNFFLGITVEVAEFFANEQKFKSLINRIERAKKGIPTSGKLPFGRHYSKETGEWKITKEGRKIKEIARLYLEEDVSFKELGKRYGMNPTNLCKILKFRCGGKWKQEFISQKFEIKEVIEIDIPPLLSDETVMLLRQSRRLPIYEPLKAD